MLNKDFLRMVFREEKKLLGLADVKWIEVPKLAELSVVNLYPVFKDDKTMMAFFPDKLPKGRLPDRTYFFNVMNTMYGDYTKELVRSAQNNRHKVDEGEEQVKGICVTDEWWRKLNEAPFSKCKFIYDPNPNRT